MSRKTIIRSTIPVVLIIAAAVAFAVFEPIQVLPRIRIAPGFLLTDHNAETITSEDMRGNIVLYNFGYTGCGEQCDQMNDTMLAIQGRLDEVDAILESKSAEEQSLSYHSMLPDQMRAVVLNTQ